MTLRLLRLLSAGILGGWLRPQSLASLAAAGLLAAGLFVPLAALSRETAPVLAALDGPRGVATTFSLLSLLLLLPTPLLAMSLRKDDRLCGAWDLVETLAALPLSRSAALRLAAAVSALRDAPGWLVMLWCAAMSASASGTSLVALLPATPLLALALACWHLALLVCDLLMLRWLSSIWRRRLPRLASVVLLALALCLAASFAGATRGRDSLFEAVSLWDRISPAWSAAAAWPACGAFAGISLSKPEPREAAASALQAAAGCLLVLGLLPPLVAGALRRGALALSPCAAVRPTAAKLVTAGRFRGLALLDEPGFFKFAALASTGLLVAGAGLAQGVPPGWLLVGLGPVLGAAAAVALFRDAAREFLLLRLPMDTAEYMQGRAAAAAALALCAVLPPVLLLDATAEPRELLFPIAWGVFATLAAAWAGVAVAAALYSTVDPELGGQRAVALVLLLSAILGPLVAAGSQPDLPRALWTGGLSLLAACRLWQTGNYRFRWMLDPEPPPRPGDRIDPAVWLLLGAALVAPLATQAMETLGIGGRGGALLTSMALLPCVLGAAAWALLPPAASPRRGLLQGLAAGGALLAANWVYSGFAAWLGWLDPARPEGGSEALMLLADNPLMLVAAALLAGLVIPAAEETFFRGLLFGALKEAGGAGQARAVSSLAFALLHPLPHAPWILLLGFVNCRLRERHGGLTAPIAAHALCNSALLLLGAAG